jgi:epoxyqueuosine reductase QueG
LKGTELIMVNHDQKLTNATKEQILSQGADLVGVASVDRWSEWPEETRPTAYMPEARSVVVLGMRIPQGINDVWGSWTEPGKSTAPYLFYGYGLMNMELARIVHFMMRQLEYKGHKTLAFPPTWSVSFYRYAEQHLYSEDAHKAFLADFSHRHAAVAAGLGELGWHGLLITPRFGTAQRLVSLITDAPLVPDPMYEGPPLCNKKTCAERFRNPCVAKCPTGAMNKNEGQTCVIGRRKFYYCRVDKIRCHWGIEGYVKGAGGRTDLEIPPGPGRMEDLLAAAEKRHPVDSYYIGASRGIIVGDFCGNCLRYCPAPSDW